MSERTRKKIVYGALFFATIWGIYNFVPRNKPLQETSSTALNTAVVPLAAVMNPVEKTINVAEMKSKGWGEDPFRAVDKSTAYRAIKDEPRWRLTGIVYNDTKPLAIINGKSVKQGDRMGTATVVKISPKTVILEQSGATVTLRVSKV